MHKPKKKSGFTGFEATNADSDVYDYDFGNQQFSTSSKQTFFEPEEFSQDGFQKNGNKKTKEPNTSPPVRDSSESALQHAQDMLNKYSGKSGNKAGLTKPKYIPRDFDEDDISLGSSDVDDYNNKSSKKAISGRTSKPTFKDKQVTKSGEKYLKEVILFGIIYLTNLNFYKGFRS